MIELKNISFGYGKDLTIKDLSLSIPQGDFVAIVGTNGAGKTTISKIIRRLLKENSGSVFIDGEDVTKTKVSLLASKIGFLFQNPDRQICKNTVYEELLFTLICSGTPKEHHTELIEKALKSFDLNKDDETAFMSRGEKQRLALASALVAEPKILILDEPTTGLDFVECIKIMEIIKSMNNEGVTVIMVCHDMELALDYAKRLVVMTDGEIVGDGTPLEIFCDNEILQKASLLPPQIVALSMMFSNLPISSTPEEFAKNLLEYRRPVAI